MNEPAALHRMLHEVARKLRSDDEVNLPTTEGGKIERSPLRDLI
jgi:hypothetical protein